MKMTRTSLVLVTVLAFSACLLAATASASAGRAFVEHTETLSLPEGWIKGDRLAADETVELLIAVRLTNADELERRCVPSFLALNPRLLARTTRHISSSIFAIFLFPLRSLLRSLEATGAKQIFV
jgi:hypothetical protein